LNNAALSRRFVIYAGVNLAFFLGIAIAYAYGDSSNPRLLYLILLFALCSTPIIDLDGLNGRYALLGLFLIAYFVMFGASDVTALAQQTDAAAEATPTSQGLTRTEMVILAGGILAYLGYRVAVAARSAIKEPPLRRDWPKPPCSSWVYRCG